MFLRASQRGDDDARAKHWNELVELNFDRVVGMVKSYSRGHLSDIERDEAIQRALIKLCRNMIDTFHGSSMGEWVQSTRTLVKGVCIDVQRAEIRHSRRLLYLDHAAGEDDPPVRTDASVYAAIEKARREEERAEEDDDAMKDGSAFLDWAIPQLPKQRRLVLELDRRGLTVEQIQAKLGVSREVVYACRSRALKDLTRLREDYQP